jgi:hypothetical protein
VLLLLAHAHAEVVDRILHVVGERIVTASDVAFEAALDPHDESPIRLLERPEYAYEDRLVDYAVLRELAGDVEVFRPAGTEVRARWETFRDRWAHREDRDAFLARWGLDDERMQGFLYSRMVVEKYIARNILTTRREDEDPLTRYRTALDEASKRIVMRTPR